MNLMTLGYFNKFSGMIRPCKTFTFPILISAFCDDKDKPRSFRDLDLFH